MAPLFAVPFIAGAFAIDAPASNSLTRSLLGWTPTHPTLLEDLHTGDYFNGEAPPGHTPKSDSRSEPNAAAGERPVRMLLVSTRVSRTNPGLTCCSSMTLLPCKCGSRPPLHLLVSGGASPTRCSAGRSACTSGEQPLAEVPQAAGVVGVEHRRVRHGWDAVCGQRVVAVVE